MVMICAHCDQSITGRPILARVAEIGRGRLPFCSRDHARAFREAIVTRASRRAADFDRLGETPSDYPHGRHAW